MWGVSPLAGGGTALTGSRWVQMQRAGRVAVTLVVMMMRWRRRRPGGTCCCCWAVHHRTGGGRVMEVVRRPGGRRPRSHRGGARRRVVVVVGVRRARRRRERRVRRRGRHVGWSAAGAGTRGGRGTTGVVRWAVDGRTARLKNTHTQTQLSRSRFLNTHVSSF